LKSCKKFEGYSAGPSNLGAKKMFTEVRINIMDARIILKLAQRDNFDVGLFV